MWKIFHNPRCGTSRKVLEALRSNNIEPEVVEYLSNPPTPGELDGLLKLGGLSPEQVVRKKEGLYSELGLADKALSRAEWLKVLSENPILIERPLVTDGKKTVLARPPERLAELLP